MGRVKWLPWFGLIAVLAVGLFLRLHGLTRYSIWRDESWAVYLATGRGNLLFDIPFQTLVTNPPNVGFENAPHWWHIWNTLDGVAHPPGYYIALRWWIDLFGQSDRSIRTMSLLFGLAGIILLFDTVRIMAGPWRGLTAAAIMALAPIQIDFSQQARPYTLAAFVGLIIYNLLLRIERSGTSRLKLVALVISVALAMLIHYFMFGIVAGAAVYAFLRFKPVDRRRALAAIVAGVAFVAVAWGSFIPQSRKAFTNALGEHDPRTNLVLSTIDAPQRLLFHELDHTNWLISGAIAILIFSLPLIDRRKLIWWLWTFLSLGCVLAIDVMQHSVVMQIDRYICLAGAGVYALAALPVGSRIGWLAPLVILGGVIIAAAGQYEFGPVYSPGSVYMWEEDRRSADFLRNRFEPGDAVVITDNLITYAEFTYWATAHYNGQWTVPIVLLRDPIEDPLRKQLLSYRRVWVIGQFPAIDTKRLLPGCQVIDVGGTVAYDSVWRVK